VNATTSEPGWVVDCERNMFGRSVFTAAASGMPFHGGENKALRPQRGRLERNARNPRLGPRAVETSMAPAKRPGPPSQLLSRHSAAMPSWNSTIMIKEGGSE
jgi:hypothetical protein